MVPKETFAVSAVKMCTTLLAGSVYAQKFMRCDRLFQKSYPQNASKRVGRNHSVYPTNALRCSLNLLCKHVLLLPEKL